MNMGGFENGDCNRGAQRRKIPNNNMLEFDLVGRDQLKETSGNNNIMTGKQLENRCGESENSMNARFGDTKRGFPMDCDDLDDVANYGDMNDPRTENTSRIAHGNIGIRFNSDRDNLANYNINNSNFNQGRISNSVRQSLLKDLPIFAGDPKQWPSFIAYYKYSTLYGNILPWENLMRLNKCLKGVAKEAVYTLLTHPNNVDDIISKLSKRFGRPEYIIGNLLEELERLPSVKNNHSLVKYATSVSNLITTIKQLNSNVHIFSPDLLKKLLWKLPEDIQRSWGQFAMMRSNISLVDFNEWMSRMADAVEETIDTPVFGISSKDFRKNGNNIVNVHSERKIFCFCCNSANHLMTNCPELSAMSYEDRWKTVRQARVCFSCFQKGHGSNKCRIKNPCKINGCKYKKHHTLLHKPENYQSNSKKIEEQNIASTSAELNCHSTSTNQVIFKIIPVILSSETNSMVTWAFIDEGSSVSLIDEDIADKLELPGTEDPLCIRWTGNTFKSENNSKRVNLQISGVGAGMKKFQLKNIRTISNLGLPRQSLDVLMLKKQFPYLQDVPLENYKEVQPQILIGMDHFKLGLTYEVKEGAWKGPAAVKTRLGWVIVGNSKFPEDSQSFCFHICDCENVNHLEEKDLHQVVRDFFSVENFGVIPMPSDRDSMENMRSIKLFEATTTIIGNRFQTGLPWKNEKFVLPDSFSTALRRLHCLESKMSKDLLFANMYKQKMQENFEKGYARELKAAEIKAESGIVWYLPHFAVQNPNKPGKMRIVFDAASLTNKISLNSLLLTGPDLYKPLFGVLFKFRENAIAISADIQEMFSQIRIRPVDQNAQRFLWRNKNNDIVHCVMESLIFGATCSPFIAQMVKNSNAAKFDKQFPRAVEGIIQRHYVDDYLDSFEDVTEAIATAQQVKEIHSKAGFNIRNFISNSSEVVKKMNSSVEDSLVNLNVETGVMTERVLGMFWDTKADVFLFKLNPSRISKDVIAKVRILTKREYLRIIMSLFDPLGLLAHYMIYPKIILQNIWKSGVDWDEPIKEEHSNMFFKWWNGLSELQGLRIPRCYLSSGSNPENFQLHILVDASEMAFGAVAYLRSINSMREVKLTLLCAKSRVAPLKMLSIPRLELQAAVLGARLAETICKEHSIKFKSRVFWSDSKTVLGWLYSDNPRKYKPFVGHRLSEILEKSTISEWSFVPTKDNVADEATKWSKIPKLSFEQRWFSGPEFLLKSPKDWPKATIHSCAEEAKAVNLIKNYPMILDTLQLNRFSNWGRLCRAIGYVLLAIENFKLSIEKQQLKHHLTTKEIFEAKNILYRKAQQEVYMAEVSILKSQTKVPNTSSIYKFSPYLDENQVLRVNGRIDALSVGSEETKRPLILPTKHHITFLIVRWYHLKFKHKMDEFIVNEIRQAFWIPHLRVLVRKVKASCQLCKNNRATAPIVEMSPLPKQRLAAYCKPFTYTGLDFFGPVMVTIGRARHKRWVALFTCLTTRAVHLELAHDLSSNACILVLRNFINRRGTPIEIISDNGTNFVGTKSEIQGASDAVKGAQTEGTMRGIKWSFIPPRSPHMGGAWERPIKSVKSVLDKILHEKAPREETFRSFLIEIENILNARPLTYVSLETPCDEALTPNHFLVGSSNGIREPGEYKMELKKQWRIAQELTNHFWKRWLKEYVPKIIHRPKWHESVDEILVGDVVLILDENSERNSWPKAVVLELHQSKDGKARSATLKTATGFLTRPVHKLVVLDVLHNTI
jgi:transposase InsO family protein